MILAAWSAVGWFSPEFSVKIMDARARAILFENSLLRNFPTLEFLSDVP